MTGDTPESICTLAMTYLGADPVQSLATPETQEEVICGRIYTNLKQTLLSKYPWRFAMKTEQLSRDVQDPPVRWAYQFTLPPDRLKNAPYRLYPSAQAGERTIQDFEDVGEKIFSNQPVLFMQYTFEVDEDKWPPYFVEFMAHAIAARTANAVTGNSEMVKTYTVLAFGSEGTEGALFREARRADAKDRPNRVIESDPLSEARFGPV